MLFGLTHILASDFGTAVACKLRLVTAGLSNADARWSLRCLGTASSSQPSAAQQCWCGCSASQIPLNHKAHCQPLAAAKLAAQPHWLRYAAPLQCCAILSSWTAVLQGCRAPWCRPSLASHSCDWSQLNHLHGMHQGWEPQWLNTAFPSRRCHTPEWFGRLTSAWQQLACAAPRRFDSPSVLQVFALHPQYLSLDALTGAEQHVPNRMQ